MKSGHALVVSDGYGMEHGPCAQRGRDLCQSLLDNGWKVSVLTQSAIAVDAADDSEIYSVPTTQITRMIPTSDKLVVVKLPVPTHPTDPLVSRWPLSRLKDAGRWAATDATSRAASWCADELAMWRPRLEASAINIENSQHVDLVIGLIPSVTSLVIGSLFHSLWRTPYAIDVVTLPEPKDFPDDWRWISTNASFIWCCEPAQMRTMTDEFGVAARLVETWNPTALVTELSGEPGVPTS